MTGVYWGCTINITLPMKFASHEGIFFLKGKGFNQCREKRIARAYDFGNRAITTNDGTIYNNMYRIFCYYSASGKFCCVPVHCSLQPTSAMIKQGFSWSASSYRVHITRLENVQHTSRHLQTMASCASRA